MKIFVKGTKLKANYIRAGFTNKTLAERINISPCYLSSIVNGKSSIGAEKARDIVELLLIEFDDVFTII